MTQSSGKAVIDLFADIAEGEAVELDDIIARFDQAWRDEGLPVLDRAGYLQSRDEFLQVKREAKKAQAREAAKVYFHTQLAR